MPVTKVIAQYSLINIFQQLLN